MSETTSDTTLAGQAAAASRPPLMRRDMLADRVHRGDRRAGGEQRLVDGDLVGQRQTRRGDGSSAEPPPEISATTRSSAVRPCDLSSSRREASRPAASGTGCAASMISMRSQGAP